MREEGPCRSVVGPGFGVLFICRASYGRLEHDQHGHGERYGKKTERGQPTVESDNTIEVRKFDMQSLDVLSNDDQMTMGFII
jgi:hypothetical protein